MSQDFLSQQEVDLLLAGVTDEATEDDWAEAMSKPIERDLTAEQLKTIVRGEIESALTDIEKAYVRRDCWQQFDYLLARLKVGADGTAHNAN